MAYRSVEESSLTGIADAIRSAGETEGSLLFPGGFQTAISNLGGKGAALTVTAPAGATVTVSKDGKTLTRVAGADGIAIFRGLETGTWTLSITDGTQTASKMVEIVTDYATTITFFAATINVTYPAGSTCTATDGVTTLTAPDTSGAWACVVPNAGTWTITISNGSTTKSADVSISEDQQIESISLSYLLWLFDSGDTCDDATGGWANTGYTYYGPSYSVNRPTVGTQIKCSTSNHNQAAIAGTQKSVDLTNYSTLHVNLVTYSGAKPKIAVTGSERNTYASNAKAYAELSIGETTVDVSELTEDCYIALLSIGSVAIPSTSLTVDKIWLT